jgi:hypothetical protein
MGLPYSARDAGWKGSNQAAISDQLLAVSQNAIPSNVSLLAHTVQGDTLRAGIVRDEDGCAACSLRLGKELHAQVATGSGAAP